MPLPVTALYAALLGLVYAGLTLLVVRGRLGTGVMLGNGEDRGLHRAVRAHGNFAEFVPIILILIGLGEGLELSAFLLHLLGAGLLAARILHAIGISQEPDLRPARGGGAILTLAVLIIASLAVLGQALTAINVMG